MITGKISTLIGMGRKHFGNTPYSKDLVKNLIKQSPVRTYVDKLGRKISEYSGNACIAENKGGSKIISIFNNGPVNVTIDKSGRIIREVTSNEERFFLPNGNFIEISKRNGKRGDFLVYTPRHPKGADVRVLNERPKYRYSTIYDSEMEKPIRLRSCDGKIDIFENEKDWMRHMGVSDGKVYYAPEILRALLKGII